MKGAGDALPFRRLLPNVKLHELPPNNIDDSLVQHARRGIHKNKSSFTTELQTCEILPFPVTGETNWTLTALPFLVSLGAKYRYCFLYRFALYTDPAQRGLDGLRSEERRVGKECAATVITWWGPNN